MESIYNLIPRSEIAEEKEPMYRSKHNPRNPVTGSTFCTTTTTRLPGAGVGGGLPARRGRGEHLPVASHALFGKDDVRPDPRMYLKAGAHNAEMTGEIQPFRYSGPRKAGVPPREEKPVMGLHTTKNFVTANAVEAILQVPRIRDNSEPDYLRKVDFGRVPAYLDQVKDEIKRENEMIDAYVKQQMGVEEEQQQQATEMSESERSALIDALKSKWDAVNHKFQKVWASLLISFFF
jgi:hypothetical protein